MPTPANRAKIQLVRGTYSNIAASIADLVDGELCYAKDTNRLYMVEGTVLTPIELDPENIEDTIAGIIQGGIGINVNHDDINDIISINLSNTAVNAGTYGSFGNAATFVVNAQGRIVGAGQTGIPTQCVIRADSSTTTDVFSLFDLDIDFEGGNGIVTTHSWSTSPTLQTVTFDLEASGVTAGSYGSATAIPAITVDTYGRITAVTTSSISTDLSIAGDTGTDTISSGDTFTFTGGTGIGTSVSSDTVFIFLEDSGVTAGVYGSGSTATNTTFCPILTVDAKGRITNATSFEVLPSGIRGFGDYVHAFAGNDDTQEPMGITDRDSLTNFGFTNSTRTLYIGKGTSPFSWTHWHKGERYNHSGTETVVIPNTDGLHYIYFDGASLNSSQTYFDFSEVAPVAYVYWDSTLGEAIYFGDERHGITLDWATHEYLHRTRGAVIANGFSISNYTISGSGLLDSHATIGLSGGTFFDEDLKIEIQHAATPAPNSFQQVLDSTAEIPVFYQINQKWARDTARTFPFKQGSTYPIYNEFNQVTQNWGTPQAANNKWFVYFIIATNNINEPVISIPGQAEYNNIGDAEAAQWGDLSLGSFPSLEFRPLYKLVYRAGLFGNSVNCRLESVQDIRQLDSAATGQAIASDHGLLSGLGDDDHNQYLHTQTSRGAITANINTSGTLKTTNTTASTSSSTGAMVVSGGLGVGGDVFIAGGLTVDGTTTTIDSATLLVEDKNIELGNVTTPSDATADGGGITLKGATDKTISWVDATDAWTSSEHINLAATKQYYLNGTMVLGYDGSDEILDNVIIDGGTY